MKLIKRNNVFYLRLRRGNVDVWLSTYKTTRRDAERAAQRILMMFDREKQTRHLAQQLCRYAVALAKGEISKERLASPMKMLESEAMMTALSTIEEIFPLPPVHASDLWDKYMESVGTAVKKSTLTTKKQRFSKFAEWAQDMDMSLLNELLCRNFLDSLTISAQTRKNYISDLSSIWNSCDYPNPWTASLRSSNLTTAPTERQEISLNDAQAICRYCDHNAEKKARNIPYWRWAQFIRTLYYTGLRPVDVCHLRKSEVKNGTIELLPEKTSRTRRKVSYKADPALLELLNAIEVDETGMFFPEFAVLYDRHRANLDPGFKRIVTNAGLDGKGITLYGFRHHYITYQIDSGKSEEDVASAVGHSSTDTTQNFYYHGRRNVELTDMPKL